MPDRARPRGCDAPAPTCGTRATRAGCACAAAGRVGCPLAPDRVRPRRFCCPPQPFPRSSPPMNLFIRLLVNAVALWCAAHFIDGISYTGTWPGLLGLALVFGVVNTLIRPILSFFSFPIQIVTLGIFTLVLNALMLMLTSYL